MSVATGSPELNDDDFKNLQSSNLIAEPTPDLREILSLGLLVTLADLTIYRGEGYAGLGLLLLLAPILLLIGSLRRTPDKTLLCFWVMLALSALRLLWCGTPLAATVGLLLIPCFSMSRSGLRPFVPESCRFLGNTIASGGYGIAVYANRLWTLCRRFTHWNWIIVALPLVVGVLFSLVFLQANPDLLKSVGEYLSQIIQRLVDWVAEYPLLEILFCLAAGWIGIGLLRPRKNHPARELEERDCAPLRADPNATPDPLFDAYRNTLWLVIALFAGYLVFEFRTMWFRGFPVGFHYSGYAHEGAAWLTVALALATGIISLIFQGRILRDRRINSLVRLTFAWSIENLLLAVAVYYRLMIYVEFNGMTWARIVGFYGVTTVVAGFLLVLWKIRRSRNFIWLIRRQLWALTFAIYLYSITPVDYLAMSYNARRILAGDPKPAVQFSVQSISTEGVIALRTHFDRPNVHLADPLIERGIHSLLRERYRSLDQLSGKYGWTAWQLSESLIRRRSVSHLPPSDDRDRTDWDLFKNHVYQWF